ncbi:transcriptional regulator PpsR [Methylibium sp.]|uniref:transcriptional regulator PpsR n=1 Tax=Methylibium sp. TaxID=2067992 RepID=UPI003D124703
MKSFDEPTLSLGDLDTEAAGRLIAASSDVALIVDGEGIIRDLAFGNDELSKAGYQDWLGKPWAQTVTVESRPKVEALLRELGGKGAPKWRHINHPSADGADLPLLYAAVPVGSKGHALAVGRSVAFGRDLRANAALQQRLVSAQQSMERDYWRMRHMETRYRVLFQVSSEPVLILDAATLKLEDANPAASKLLGDATQRAGWSLARAFDAAGQAAVDELFAAVRATGRSDTVKARLGKDGSEWTVSASLFRQEKSSHFLVRLSALRHAIELPKPNPKDMLLRLVESAPDGFVVTDLDGLILTANQAFLDLAQLATEEQARGVSLEKWLGRTGVDLSVLISNLRQRGAVRLFATSMRGEYGSTAEVEISAVAATEGDHPCLGFTIRDVGRRLPSDARASREVPRSVGQMTELVGRVPLREIVRDTTDLIEQLCIEAALQLTRDNRASAAEMLGLSRQSLYVKLRRYGLGDATVDSES